LRCSRCGNDNPETNRFCGMCGATMLQAPSGSQDRPARTTSASGSHAAATATQPQNLPQRAPSSTPPEVSPISGPSFLGLNDPPPKQPRDKANLSIDPGLPGSRSLDYLLDDEEESRGGAGKYFIIVLAVLLLLGFGYMRWKSDGFPWLPSSGSKPSATAPSSDAGDANSNPPAPSASAPTNTQPATGNTPANSGTSPAAGNPSNSTANPAGNPAANSAPAQPAPTQPAPSQPSASSGGQSGGSQPGAGTTPAPDTNDSDDKDSDDNAAPADKSTNAAPDTTTAPAAKPAPPPKPRPAVPKDQVAEARKYLYGLGGTPQSCDRGMRLLKPLAEQANAKAMIEMGALYSAGLCTPRDLPTAYRWFAMALRKDPDNQSLQSDLQKLWGEMTQPERQLAIRLSQ
jgi:hypothetical protein